jgi:4-amino-4-deoxychorismate lyase
MAILAIAVLGRGLVDPQQPVLRADDEALLRGRAAFETTRVYGGRPFRLNEHLVRLLASAERIALPEPDAGALRDLVDLALTGIKDASLRLVWTPGPADGESPVGLAIVGSIPPDLEQMRARGMDVVSLSVGVPYELRAKAPWILGGVKSTSYAANMAATAEAQRRGADDAIFLASDEVVLEGPTTNVWWRNGDTLFTPSLETGILAGITREVVIERAPAVGFEVVEGVFRRSDFASAEEAFTSSSVRELMPIVSLDGAAIGSGRPGRAQAALQIALRRLAGEL